MEIVMGQSKIPWLAVEVTCLIHPFYLPKKDEIVHFFLVPALFCWQKPSILYSSSELLFYLLDGMLLDSWIIEWSLLDLQIDLAEFCLFNSMSIVYNMYLLQETKNTCSIFYITGKVRGAEKEPGDKMKKYSKKKKLFKERKH